YKLFKYRGYTYRRGVLSASMARFRQLSAIGVIVRMKMLLSRLTLGRVVVAWLVFLWCAGLVLPNLDSHAQVHPAGKAIVAAGFATLLVGTPIALAIYFNRAWRRVGTVANRTAFVVWIDLE